MSDLFHESIPAEFILKVFRTMRKANQHTFQVLTKRSERLADLDSILTWTDNIWAGVTVENSAYLDRIEHLQSSKATIKFLSLEPCLAQSRNSAWQVLIGLLSEANRDPERGR